MVIFGNSHPIELLLDRLSMSQTGLHFRLGFLPRSLRQAGFRLGSHRKLSGQEVFLYDYREFRTVFWSTVFGLRWSTVFLQELEFRTDALSRDRVSPDNSCHSLSMRMVSHSSDPGQIGSIRQPV